MANDNWSQWVLDSLGKILCAIAVVIVFICTVAWSGYSSIDQRLLELEKQSIILDIVARDVATIKEYVVAKEDRTKDFYARRPLFWSDMETILNHKHGDE